MKKKIMLIVLTIIINIVFPIDVILAIDSLPSLSSRNQCGGRYEIAMISSGNTPSSTVRCPVFDNNSYDNISHVSCADTYETAKSIMNGLNSTKTNVASIIYNGNIIDAKYAMLDLRTKGTSASNTNVFSTNNGSNGYINGYFGVDAPLLDYNPSNGRAKLKISGLVGWIDKRDSQNLIQYNIIPISIARSPSYYYINYNANVGFHELIHNIGIASSTSYASGRGVSYYNCNPNIINLGPAPHFLQAGERYYSYDGHYFYKELTTMIDDYKTNIYTNAINSNDPYYNYYQFLSYRTKTSYTGADINHYLTNVRGYTAKPNLGASTPLPGHQSMLFNEGNSFVEAQNEFGANALLTFGISVNESGWGRSWFAVNRNNVFGHGAYDYDPGSGASTYASIKSGIDYHSDYWVSSWYLHPDDWRYSGGHVGNKLSGMNVRYASDPYWGEKTAQHYYGFDRSNGMADFEQYKLGIKNTTNPTIDLAVRKEPTTTSSALYSMRYPNSPVVILDTVEGQSINGNNIWYKVQSDVKMDSSRNKLVYPSYRATYNWGISYAYIHSSTIRIVSSGELYIVASSKTILQGSVFDPMVGVTAYDRQLGDITSSIEIIKNEVNTSQVGNYEVIYRVSNGTGKEVTKNIIITVRSDTPPVINAGNIEILQYQPFNPLQNVTATDNEDGNITHKMNVINRVNNLVVGTYEVKYSVTDSDGNYIEKIITVTVSPSDQPLINANDRVIERGTAINLLQGVTAYDNEDGDLTNSIRVVGGNVNTDIPGIYYITYSVTDSDNNRTNKTIKVTVNGNYTQVDGNFYLHTFNWQNDDTMEISGYLTINQTNNTRTQNIIYELMLKNVNNDEVYVLPLQRWTEFNSYPFKIPSGNGFDYSDSWFKGTVDLSDVPEGDYETLVKARMNGRETTAVLRNTFSRNITRKATDNDGRGYLFRTNYLLRTMPLELFVRDNGLISDATPPTPFDNMFNSYSRIDLLKNNDSVLLDIRGNSFSINGDYRTNQNIIRNIIFENTITRERFVKNLGYVDNANVGTNRITLRVPDGKDKTRAWFDNKVNLDDLNVGRYIIYIKTKTGTVEDYGELNDISFRKLSKSIISNGKTYTLILNEQQRGRIELIVSAN